MFDFGDKLKEGLERGKKLFAGLKNSDDRVGGTGDDERDGFLEVVDEVQPEAAEKEAPLECELCGVTAELKPLKDREGTVWFACEPCAEDPYVPELKNDKLGIQRGREKFGGKTEDSEGGDEK